MIKSYSDIYVDGVSNNVGTMLEYAFRCEFDPFVVWKMFVSSDVAYQIEKGNPRFLTGYSGRDYLDIVINTSPLRKESKHLSILLKEDKPFSFNEYYWAGEMIARFQQRTGITFFEIEKRLPLTKVISMYTTLHEADIEKFFEEADKYIGRVKEETNLKRIRIASGMSQSQLAKESGVLLRSIQMYEQRRNDINKASIDNVYKLSKALGCNIKDLMEVGNLK